MFVVCALATSMMHRGRYREEDDVGRTEWCSRAMVSSGTKWMNVFMEVCLHPRERGFAHTFLRVVAESYQSDSTFHRADLVVPSPPATNEQTRRP